jgi:hypothetical protein
VIALAAALALAAAEPTAAELLARGQASFEQLEYEQAAEDLMRAAGSPDATDDVRLRAHMLAGIANRIVGRDVDAQLNFRYVLRADPEARLPDGTSPKVSSFFEVIRGEVKAENARDARTRPAEPAGSASAAAPPVAPAPGAAPSAPAEDGGSVAPMAVLAGGAALALIGTAGVLGAEAFLRDPTQGEGARRGVQVAGMTSTVAIIAGVVTAGAGGAWLAVGSGP